MAKDMYQKRRERKEAKVNNDQSLHKTSINWYPGHMAKAKNDIKKNLKLVDIVCVVLDARIPYTSNNKELYEIIKQKTVIIVFNKSDLAYPKKLEEAEAKYRKEGCYTIKTNSITGDGIKELLTLINDLGKRVRFANKTSEKFNVLKPLYRVMIIGIPNVGKSSVINKLAGKNKAKTGNKPGVTLLNQWIKLGTNVELLDTPGVLWPSLDEVGTPVKLALTGNIKDEVFDNELVAIDGLKLIMSQEIYMKTIKARYNIDEDITCEMDMLNAIGKRRGAVIKGGDIDIEKAAKIFIEDYKSGKLGKISLE